MIETPSEPAIVCSRKVISGIPYYAGCAADREAELPKHSEFGVAFCKRCFVSACSICADSIRRDRGPGIARLDGAIDLAIRSARTPVLLSVSALVVPWLVLEALALLALPPMK